MSSSTEYGKRLLPRMLDDLASSEPNRIIYSLAKSSDISQGFRHVSARSFAKAVDKTAWWLHDQVGDTTSIQPMGYIGPHDLRYILLTYACVKIGYAALFLSPKNSIPGALNVLKATNCNIWVKAQDEPCIPLVKELLEKRPLKLLELPTLDDLLNAENSEPYPYTKTFDEAIDDPLCFLHTSGSTGLPKPISWRNGLLASLDAVQLLPPTEGDQNFPPWTSTWRDGDTIYSTFPMSHAAGLIMDILMPAFYRLHCVLGPVGVLPNINLLESLADHGKIDIWSMVPSLVDELGETPDVLEKYTSSKFVCASGGPVSPVSASKVNEKIRVFNLTGTTEGLFIGNLIVEREDWQYFAFHPFSGFEFKEVEPGLYEHWIHRNEHWPLFQGIFHTFPDQLSINFKDLYVQHPTKPGLWAYKGRSDDLVVLSNGYKISPLDTEAFITTHPAIEGCLVIGSSKPQAGLLIELKDGIIGNDELYDSIWTTIEKANSLSQHTNLLRKDYITFAETSKPFIRTDKRTIQRRATLAIYADYIEKFYDSRSEVEVAPLYITIDSSSPESVLNAIRKIVASLLPAAETASSDTDLFSLGLDSLLVFRAVTIVRATLKLDNRFGPRDFYANPTLEKLSMAITKFISKTRENKASTNSHTDEDTSKLKKWIERHRSRQQMNLTPIDHSIPSNMMQFNLLIPLREGVSFKQAFERLQEGLRRAIELLPALEGKIIPRSEYEIGYKKGQFCITVPPLPSAALRETNGAKSSKDLKQLVYKDLSKEFPSYQKLKAAGFLPSALNNELINDISIIPPVPADVFGAQANFVEGGCILAINFHHWFSDGTGIMTVIKAWAESCRYVQGDNSATCDWLDPESLNRNLLEILHEEEGYAKPVSEVDPVVWESMSYPNPINVGNATETETDKVSSALSFDRNLTLQLSASGASGSLTSSTFLISSERLAALRKDVISDPGARGVVKSDNDILQAFAWKSALRSRYRVATELRGKKFGPEDISIMEAVLETRAQFSPLLPPSFIGNLFIMNRLSIPIEELVSSKTSTGQIAYALRESTNRVTPQYVHDHFTLQQNAPDWGTPTIVGMGIDGLNILFDNIMLFPTREFQFGNDLFDNKGTVDALRLNMTEANKACRSFFVLPLREDGGVELMIGTLPEEIDMLMADEEFTKYATYLG